MYPPSQHHGALEYHPANKVASLGDIPFSTEPWLLEILFLRDRCQKQIFWGSNNFLQASRKK